MRRCFGSAVYVLLLAGIPQAGCSGNGPAPPSVPSPSPSPSPDGGFDGVEIVGGERLGWDQFAPDRDELQSYSYVLYVDGSSGSLGDLRCGNAAGDAGFECSGVLPAMSSGRHVLQLATRGQKGLSNPSTPLVVRVVPRTEGPNVITVTEETSPGIGESSAPAVCFVPGGEHCYVSQHVTDLEEEVLSIAALPDGRALVAENGRGVFGLDLTGGAPRPALEFDADILNASIAVDPLFPETRFVYLAVTLAEPSGPVVNVLRYREVGGILGQGAVLLSGLPVREAPDVLRIAIGDRGRIYLGLSGGGGEATGLVEAPETLILRYEPDGTVPRDAVAASPAFARRHRPLTAIAWPPFDDRLWLSETGGGESRLLSLRLDAKPGPEATPGTRVDLPAPEMTVASISTVRPGGNRPSGLLVLVSGNELLWTTHAGSRGNRLANWSSLRVTAGGSEASLLAAWDSSLIWLVAAEAQTTQSAIKGRVFALRHH